MELTRRNFLEGLFGAAFLAGACERSAPRSNHIEGELLGQSATSGHMLRGDMRERLAHIATIEPERTGVVIAGGGPSGLSAARCLSQTGYEDYLLLELESTTGGTSLGASSTLTAYPWGAHYLPVPHRQNAALVELLREMGVVSGVDDAGKLRVSEPHLVRAPEERLFYRGYWYPGQYLNVGASAADLAERARFEQLVARWVRYRDMQGRRAFTLPLSQASDASEVRALDTLSAEAFLRREGFRSARLYWLLDYACRDDYGLTLAQASAWALLFYFAARIDEPGEAASDFLTWPDGNYALVRHLSRSSAKQTRSHVLVLDVTESDQQVDVLAWDTARDTAARFVCERAIVATPRFITTRIVRSLRDAAQEPAFPYAPWLVANLHMRERPRSHGAPLAWDNLLYESPSVGYVCATHQRGSDYGPTVLTYYLPLTDADAKRARQRLFVGEYPNFRDALLTDLERAHVGLGAQVERLDVFRWGHAMVRPEVGFMFSSARTMARAPCGRIHFAHSDLSGVALFEEAFDHGLRAGSEVLSALGRVPP